MENITVTVVSSTIAPLAEGLKYTGPVSEAGQYLPRGTYACTASITDSPYDTILDLKVGMRCAVAIGKKTGRVYGNPNGSLPITTANGVPISHGLRVFDNNMEIVTVNLHGSVRAEIGGDIWFDTSRLDGSPSHTMNGERVATRFQGWDAATIDALPPRK